MKEQFELEKVSLL